MIKVENVIINGKEYKKTYSNEHKYIQKKGTKELYVEAIDLLSSNFEYVETNKDTDEEIEKPEEGQEQ